MTRRSERRATGEETLKGVHTLNGGDKLKTLLANDFRYIYLSCLKFLASPIKTSNTFSNSVLANALHKLVLSNDKTLNPSIPK